MGDIELKFELAEIASAFAKARLQYKQYPHGINIHLITAQGAYRPY